MTLKITIKTDNAAFEDESGTECARILRQLASELDGRDLLPGESIALSDYNGNKVGRASV
jgi:hypothetical protein